MTDLAKWLDQIGLGEYAKVFAENDIDLELLPELTADDLRDMGVTSVGHRRKILSAASQATNVVPAAPQKPVAPVVPVPVAKKTPIVSPKESDAERRIISVLFCDLVGSTSLSSEMDAEEYRDLISRYRAELSGALEPYDGHLAQFVGDGVVVFFGVSRVQDHDAENAVAAGLDIVERMASLPPIGGKHAAVRIGIATGLSIVPAPDRIGALLGDTAVGEVPNIAARLQDQTEPNSVIVSDDTRKRLGDLFTCQDMGPLQLKGVHDPVQAWRILEHASAPSRFDALRPIGRGAQFVGRDAELSLLTAQSRRAQAGFGQIAIITGEAGMGKSRLARELIDAEGGEAAAQPVLQCTPYHSGTPFHPFRHYLTKYLGLGDESGNADGRVSSFLTGIGLTDDVHADLMMDVLRPPDTATPGAGLTQERRGELLRFLEQMLRALGRTAQAIIIEDIQWIDPSTLELLDRVAPTIHTDCIHLVCTARPGRLPVWVDVSGARQIHLDPLDESSFAPLVESVAKAIAPGLTLPGAQMQGIIERCGGSPVFAEELTRFALEALASGETDVDSLSQDTLPATLEDSLLARLDKLELGRRLAQLGAVIGKEFPVDILLAICDMPENEARRGITELLDAGVFQVGHSTFGTAISFRHMLLQEAAYQTLLRRDRLALHLRIAGVLSESFPTISDGAPQIIAYHFSKGQDYVTGAREWGRAGALAENRSAYAEAVSHYRRALKDVGQSPKSIELQKNELNIRVDLVSALVASRGFSSPEVQSEMHLVEGLSAELDGTEQLVPLLISKWVFVGASGQTGASIDLAYQIRDLTKDGTEAEKLIGYRTVGTSLFFAGRFDAARAELVKFVDLFDFDKHNADLSKFGTSNHAVMSLLGLAEIATIQGDAVAAQKWADAAIELADKSGRAHDYCNLALFLGCLLSFLHDDFDTALVSAQQLRELSVEHSLPMWNYYADLFEGTVLLWQGETEQGLKLCRESEERADELSNFLTFCYLFQTEACLHAGDVALARRSFSSIQMILFRQDSWLSAEFLRIEARLLLAEGESHDKVMNRLNEALAVAERQKARLLSARVTRTLKEITPQLLTS